VVIAAPAARLAAEAAMIMAVGPILVVVVDSEVGIFVFVRVVRSSTRSCSISDRRCSRSLQ